MTKWCCDGLGITSINLTHFTTAITEIYFYINRCFRAIWDIILLFMQQNYAFVALNQSNDRLVVHNMDHGGEVTTLEAVINTSKYRRIPWMIIHWSWNKMAAIMWTTFWNSFFCMKTVVFQLKFHWNLFPRISSTISTNSWDNGLIPNRQWAILWINDSLFHWRVYASLSINELTV